MTAASLAFLLLLLAALISFQFYRGRKRNLWLIKSYAEELEQALRPLDQTYTWIGGYIGFRADYKTRPPHTGVQVTLTLLPRHSILFLPISRLWMRHDRLFALIRLRPPLSGEAHAVRSGYYRLGVSIDDVEHMSHERWQRDGLNFDLWFRHGPAREALVAMLERLDKPGLVHHLALVPGPNHLYCFMQAQPGEVGKTLSTLIAATARG